MTRYILFVQIKEGGPYHNNGVFSSYDDAKKVGVALIRHAKATGYTIRGEVVK